MASKWLKNKPKMKIFPELRPETPQLLGNSLTRVPVTRCASRVFIFTGDTNFPYFDQCMYMEAVTVSDYFQNFSHDSYDFCKHFNMLFYSVWFTIQ